MKRRGIRTIMDFVLNHSATNFPPFLDLVKNGSSSAYRDWYFVKSYPVRVQPNPSYVAWFNFPSMPKLNVMNPPTHDYLLGSIRYWLESAPGLSGLRLDVANEVDMRFWRDLRNMVKPSSPNVWIVGEEWGDASPWLQGDQWDASMDYPFRDACLHYFAEGSTTTSQFLASLNENRLRYAPQVSRNMMNLLSSHDTPRFLTLCHDDIALDELATAVQFSWVGAPSIYYGEEIGMDGGADPDNRRPMTWQTANQSNPLLRWYKKLIALRRSSPALQSGSVRVLESDDAKRTFAFARETSNDLAITVINRGDQPEKISFTLPTLPLYRQAMKLGLFDTLSGDRYSVDGYDLTLTLKPKSAQILRPVSSPVTLSTRQRSLVDLTRHKSHSSL